MARRNLDGFVKDFRGTVMRSVNPLATVPKGEQPKEEDYTLGLVCMVACWSTAADGSDNSMPLKDKMELYHLGEKCVAGGIVDFKASEITKLQERIAKIFVSIQTIGMAHEMLEIEAPETVTEAL